MPRARLRSAQEDYAKLYPAEEVDEEDRVAGESWMRPRIHSLTCEWKRSLFAEPSRAPASRRTEVSISSLPKLASNMEALP